MVLLRPAVLLVLAALALAAGAPPAGADGLVLTAPDRRGIPMLVTREADLVRYGTGVIVGPETVLTAKHAVSGVVQIVLPSGTVTGQVRCRAPDRDTAVITAHLPRGTPRYRIAWRTVAPGEVVRTGGYPNRRWTVASGRVAQVIRVAVLSGRRVNTPMVVFHPALHQGASGSPVLDARGFVVAIFIASNRQDNYSIALPITTGLGPCRPLVASGLSRPAGSLSGPGGGHRDPGGVSAAGGRPSGPRWAAGSGPGGRALSSASRGAGA